MPFSRLCDIFIQLSYNKYKEEGPPSHRTARHVFRFRRISRVICEGPVASPAPLHISHGGERL